MNATNTQRPLLGIGYMLLAMCIIPGIDICAKMVAERFSAVEITWLRYVFHVLWMLPVLWLTKTPLFKRPNNLLNQSIRGFMLVATTALFFLAIRDNPIPDALALVFVAPLIVTLLSPFILGEALGWRRVIAAMVGFIGVIIILNPKGANFSLSLLYALAAGFTFAGYLLYTRKISSQDSALTTLYFTGLAGIILPIPFLPSIWSTPIGNEWLILALIGFFSAFGHYFIILAFRHGEASLIAPFDYFELITASLLSFLIFGYFASAQVWLGIAIIVASGIYIAWRERVIAD